MTEIFNATAEIRALTFALVSSAGNVEGCDPQEVGLALSLLQREVDARCTLIDEACQGGSPAPQAQRSRKK